MRWIHIIRLRLRSLFLRRTVEQELEEELRYHLERDVEAGTTGRTIEDFQQRKEECRDMRRLNIVDNLLRDTRFAIRQLRKNPGFTLTAMVTLAMGMCASVAIFAFVDAALLKPLPYRDPSRLVGVFGSIPLFPRSDLSYLDYLDWKKQNKVFGSLDLYQAAPFTLSTPDGPRPAAGARVTDGFFRTLGIAPVLGRDFYPGEYLPGPQRTVLLSYGAWQQRYGGRRDILGETVTLSGAPYIIIGVLPQEFHFSPVEPVEFWAGVDSTGYCETKRSCHNLFAIARLRDGMSVQAASANLKSIAQQLAQQYPDTNRDQGAAVAALGDVIVGDVRPILLALLGGAGLLLLIASVNVASLLLVRSESRRREIAVRSSLGASAGRIMHQFVTEGLVLVVSGSAAGLALASWVMRVLLGLIPPDFTGHLTFLRGLGLHGRVWAFAGLISLFAAVLFAVTPALHFSLSKMREGLAEGSRGSAGNTWRRLGSKLVVLELATAMVLLVGAGLLGQSLYRLLHVGLGFQPEHLLVMGVAAPGAHYPRDAQAIALARQVVSRIEGLPGVKSAGFARRGLPVGNNGNTIWFHVVGRPWHGEHNETASRDVSAGYFQTLGAKLSRGRYFGDEEDGLKPGVAIVNQAFVEKYFPGEGAIGKQLAYFSSPRVTQIVGIVEDIREGPLDEAIPPILYTPFNQSPANSFSVVVRAWQAERPLLPMVAATIHEIDPDIVTNGGITMSDRISDSQSAYLHRSSAWLVGGFAVLALLLSVVGLYGVVAYSVSQRTREIGVRMALGAQPGAVYGLILKEAVWLSGAGIVIGLVCSVAAATLIRGLLFGVRSWDVSTLVAVAGVLGVSALVASYIPARRAASVNPVDALRAE
ncbi:MAG TPA: ABC transporter permease [Bryobacteraceae bacterium]|nr:ABC transporter permease [Bryobacteraceae bacterium]